MRISNLTIKQNYSQFKAHKKDNQQRLSNLKIKYFYLVDLESISSLQTVQALFTVFIYWNNHLIYSTLRLGLITFQKWP